MKREEIIRFMKESAYKPLVVDELLEALEVSPAETHGVLELLKKMIGDGDLVMTRKNRYALPSHLGLISGTIQGNAKGFAFLIPDENREKGDLYIAPADLAGALDGDRVLVREQPTTVQGKREAEVERILVRKNRFIVGTYDKAKKHGFVIPDNSRISQDIYISSNKAMGAKTGEKVVVEVTRWFSERRSPEGRITEVLGKTGESGVDILSVIRGHNLREEFPDSVRKEALQVPEVADPAEIARRRDLRDLLTITIDGADARDLDDAVTLSRDGKNRRVLGVHIADVSHYVRPGTAIEEEALSRATSVYFPDRVLPMLPEELSNGICSLNAGTDRLAMSCLMTLDDRGNIVEHEIFPSAIHVDERMTYDDVNVLLTGEDPELVSRYEKVLPMLQEMNGLAGILRSRRRDRGAIDFEFPEIKVILNGDGSVKELQKRDRGPAEMLIEDFMLAANETVAEHLDRREFPAIYRVHEAPGFDKLENFNNFLAHYELKVTKAGDEVTPREYQQVLAQVKGKPYEYQTSMMMLRSMMHARYTPKNLGHFGLAAEYYCHFTSPIRRYPDLFVHRSLKESFRGPLEDSRKEKLLGMAGRAAQLSTDREIEAEEAEREAVDLKVVQFMSGQVGETFEAQISGVIGSGFFVRLDNMAEGLVRASSLLDQFYHYDDKKMRMVGERTNRVFAIGDTVTVRLVKADTILRQLDFELEEFVEESLARGRKGRPRK